MQTSDRTYRIQALSDLSILKAFEAFADLIEGGTFSVEVAGVRTSGLTTAQDFTAQHEGSWNRSRIVTKAVCDLGTPALQIVFHRAVTTWDQGGHARATPSAWENELYLTWRPDRGEPDAEVRLSVAQIVAGLQKADLKPVAATDAFTEAMAGQVARLAELQTSVMEDADRKRREQHEAFEQRREQLESENSALLAKIKTSEIEANDRLASEATRLEARRKELDDRGHMHARRQLRADITEALAERLRRPTVSMTTLALRILIGVSISVGIAVTAYIAFLSGREVAQLLSIEREAISGGFTPPGRVALYVVLARLGASSAVAIGLIFYLLGWLRKMLDQDERVERELERYRYDIDRASWAIETILEVQNKEGGSIPIQWVSGVTHGLFRASPAKDDDPSALEALGALLNISAKAEIGPGGTRIELGRRGLRKLGKEAEELSDG